MRELMVATTILALCACGDEESKVPFPTTTADQGVAPLAPDAAPVTPVQGGCGTGTSCPQNQVCTGGGFCAPSCASAGCESGFVCTPEKWCAPDCRQPGSACPGAMSCDTSTGLCSPGPPRGDGGPLPPKPDLGPLPKGDLGSAPQSCSQGSACPKDLVCAPMGFCVPDCRVLKESCPTQHPTCDTATGLCN